jgi:hypothetical protein
MTFLQINKGFTHNNRPFIKNELITLKELDYKWSKHKDIIKRNSNKVIVSKRNTYWMFGVRFKNNIE